VACGHWPKIIEALALQIFSFIFIPLCFGIDTDYYPH